MFGFGAALLASPIALRADPAPPAPGEAPVALLVDLSSGQTLHAHEADRRFLPASVTKVMTAYLAFEMLADGRLKPEQRFKVSDATFEQWSGTGSSLFLQRGEEVSVDDLLHGITTVSANDGCVVLAEGALGSVDKWVALMNSTARKLGMADSHFGTPNGWPDEGRTFTTARDLARLTRAIFERHPDLYARYFGHRGFAHNGIAQPNHDPITGVVPGADGIKTGFTREAGYNFLGTASRDGRRLVMVLAGIDHPQDRARIARDYIEWGFAEFAPRPIFAKGATIGRAKVQDGAERSVTLRAAAPVIADIPVGSDPRVTLALRYRGPLQAPIAKGARVAELEVRIDGFAPYRVPLEAASEVPKANIWQRLVNGVLGLFA